MKKIYRYIIATIGVLYFVSCEKDIAFEEKLEPEYPTKLKYEEVTIKLPFNWNDWSVHSSGKPIENDTLNLNYISYKINKIYKLTNNDQDTSTVDMWKIKMLDAHSGVMYFNGRNFAGDKDKEGKYAVDVLVNTSGTKTIFKSAWIFHLEKE